MSELFVFGDESGVFDKAHENVFAFGGLILLSDEERQNAIRRYSAMERILAPEYQRGGFVPELKAYKLKPKHRANLLGTMSPYARYGIVMQLQKMNDSEFCDPETRQRYLDFAYKVGLKRCFSFLDKQGLIKAEDITRVSVFFDEHTTKTNGIRNLRDAMYAEFKNGTYNWKIERHFPAVFPNLEELTVKYRNSERDYLIRASDIIANQVRWHFKTGKYDSFSQKLMSVVFPSVAFSGGSWYKKWGR